MSSQKETDNNILFLVNKNELESKIESDLKSKESENKNSLSNLDLNKIRQDYEIKIQEKMKEIKGNYNESEKRNMALIELKTTTHYLEIKPENKDKIDIKFIKEKEEMEIDKKINELNSDESYYEKSLSVLNEMSTKKEYLKKEEIKKSIENIQKIKSDELNKNKKVLDCNSSSNQTSNSTYLNSKDGSKCEDSTRNETVSEKYKQKESKLNINEARRDFLLKKKLYDCLLVKTSENSSLPKKYELDDKHCAFIYDNNLETYPLTQSKIFSDIELTTKNNNLEEPLDFCGKRVKLEGELEIRECSPNNFMCKSCMEKNKKKYNLPEKYLIGINGRLARIHKKKFHCFGIFEDNKELNHCITSFTCKSCEILNLAKNYYFPNLPK